MKQVERIAEKVYLKFAPAQKRNAFLCKKARNRFHQYIRSQAGDIFVEVDPGPVGNSEIILRTAILGQDNVQAKLDTDRYFRAGYSVMLCWLKQLERYSFKLREATAIMEFGCGSARLIRHLRCLDGVKLVGTDVMPEFIDWCRANVPGIEFHVNELKPPLTFAADNSLDLVFAQSVFTHIPLDIQDAWLAELHRIIRPNGFLLATVLGEYHQKKMLKPTEQALLAQNQHYTLTAESDNASISTQLIGSWDVFQTKTEVLKAFGAKFHVCEYVPGQLDLLILQKRG